MKALRRFQVRPVLPAELQSLAELARNLRWSWHEPTRALFAELDPAGWSATHNPALVLSSVSRRRVEEAANDAGFVARVAEARADLGDYLTGDRWFQERLPAAGRPAGIAYFSAEYGIAAAIPQYSGGLGILAGDHLKTASDMGVPLIGVGLFYGAGYFRQSLTRDGRQRETYPVVDADDLPMSLLRDEDGEPVLVSLPLPDGRTLRAQVHVVRVGRVPLLLLDSDVRANDESSRRVTDRLYGGSPDHRLRQELVLGMGGVQALRAFARLEGVAMPDVYHCNEGHAGFLSIQRLSTLVTEEKLSLDAALEVVRASTVFTTHTPVPAGTDRFERSLVARYFSGECERPGVPVDAVLELGAESFEFGNPAVFNMAVLGLRTARRANGVARLHGQVSREMFRALWPGFETSEVPIGHVTNGVHVPTWRDHRLSELLRSRAPREDIVDGSVWRRSAEDGGVSARELWDFRTQARERLVAATRRRARRSWLERGAAPAELSWIDTLLDPRALTIGFARRVPTYKRLTLMLSDKERLTRLLTDPERPVQIVVAGKSHPDDEQGVGLIQELVQFADDPAVRERIVFLPDYDIALALELMPGCDVWLNNPLRPLEASGTSGMKCAINGGLNLSVLDGWWDEMADHRFGWVIPSADGVDDPQRRDTLEADGLYNLLEHTIVPLFHQRSEDGLPHVWLDMVRDTLADLAPRVSARRMLGQYVSDLYEPAARGGRRLLAEGGARAEELAAFKRRLRENWGDVRVDHVESTGGAIADARRVAGLRVGDTIDVAAYVNLGTQISPKEVSVQVVVGRADENDELRDTTTHPLALDREFSEDRYGFRGHLELDIAGPVGYAVRVLPQHELADSAAEVALVTHAQHGV